MSCPHNDTTVYESRDRGRETIVEFPYIKFRRRKCISCGHRFQTFEVILDNLIEWSDEILAEKNSIISKAKTILNGGVQ